MLTLPLSPIVEVLLFTGGTFLILLELNRPGWVVPGCIGVLSVMIGAGSVVRTAHPIAPLVAYALYAVIGLLETRFPHRSLRKLSPFVLMSGFLILATGTGEWTRILGIACATGLGFATDHLANLAYLARANKFPRGTSNTARTPETL